MRLWIGPFCFVVSIAASAACFAQTVEFFVQADFADQAGSRNVIGFDIPAQANDGLLGEEYLGCGVTVIQMDGLGIHIIGNTAPGGFGGNYVTEANIDTIPNVVSSSTFTGGASDITDNFDFVLTTPTTAAGLVVGNLGNCSATYATTVQFMDDLGGVIAEAVLSQDHPDVIFGTADGGGICGGQVPVPFDNRLFYGIVTDQLIERIRVLNPAADGDGIAIDSIQFRSPVVCGCGFDDGDVCLFMRLVP